MKRIATNDADEHIAHSPGVQTISRYAIQIVLGLLRSVSRLGAESLPRRRFRSLLGAGRLRQRLGDAVEVLDGDRSRKSQGGSRQATDAELGRLETGSRKRIDGS